MVGFLLKKANLSTPHRPSTCAAIFLFVDAASLWRTEIVKASLPEVNQFTGNCFRMVRIVLKITFLGLRYPGQRPECPSLSYYGSCSWGCSYRNMANENNPHDPKHVSCCLSLTFHRKNDLHIEGREAT